MTERQARPQARSSDGSETGDGEKDFVFTREAGLALPSIYPQIVRRRLYRSRTGDDKAHRPVRWP